MKIDLNSDLGESFGPYTMGMDKEVLQYISSANIACGWHGGDPIVMEKTVAMAVQAGVSIGAHPGFPDLLGFGRRTMDVSPTEVKAYVKYQIGALSAFLKYWGISMQHVKPHGAMYNMAVKNYSLALAIAEGIREVDESLVLVGLAGSEMIRAGKNTGLRVMREVFADRAYNDDGSLVMRTQVGAMIHEENTAIQRVIEMIKAHRVRSINGKEIRIEAETICIHGDNPKAVSFSKNIRLALEAERIAIKPFVEEHL